MVEINLKNIYQGTLKYLSIKSLLKNHTPLILITFLNVAFFMIVQILFYYFIVSKQIDEIVISKVGIINTYIKYSKFVNNKIKEFKNSNDYKIKEKQAENTEIKRLSINRNIIWMKLKNFLIIVLSIIIFCIIILTIFSFSYIQKKFNLNSKEASKITLSLSDKILILFVLGAFTTELLFFFGMVNRYEFVGDHEISSVLYNNFAKQYNTLLEKYK